MGAVGETGEEDVVDRAAEGPAGPLQVVEVDPHPLEVPVAGAFDEEGRARRGALLVGAGPEHGGRTPDGVDHGADPVADAARVGRPDGDLAEHASPDAELASGDVRGRLTDRSDGAGRHVAAGLLGAGGRLPGDDPLQVDLGRIGGPAFQLLVHLGHAHLADPVADGVVDHRPDRRTAVLQPADHDETPERTGPVEGLGVELGGEVEELAVRAGLGQHDLAQVEVEVELDVGDPRGRRHPGEAGDDALVEAWRLRDPGPHLGAEVLHVRRAVEHDQRPTVRVEPRVLLDVEHERLVVAHAGCQFGLSGSCHVAVLAALSRVVVGSRCRVVRCRCRVGGRTRRWDRRRSRAGRSASAPPSSVSAARAPRRGGARRAPA